jgi:Tfp pilus assembly protein PilN
MTTLADRPASGQLWSTMPGWGIVADLTPPELIDSRRLTSLRKLIVVGLTIVVLIVAAGYVWAMMRHSSAANVADAAAADTSRLEQSEAQYADITQLQTSTDAVKAQIATLTTTNVDMATLVAQIRTVLPHTMAIDNINATITPAAPLTAGTLADPGVEQIGQVTVTGSGQSLNDLATFDDNLQTLSGVINIVPTTNEQGHSGTTHYSITFDLTNARYETQPAATTTGGN